MSKDRPETYASAGSEQASAASSYERIMANLDTIERNLRAINRQRSIINFLAGIGIASLIIDVVRWF